MDPFEYFDHTADTMFRAYGEDFRHALSNAILAVYNVIVDTKTVAPKTTKTISVRASRKETLIYDLFEELLFLLDTESFLGCRVESLSYKETGDVFSVQATISGDTDASSYDVFGQIKAPTYNEMLIGEHEGKVFIQAVLDL